MAGTKIDELMQLWAAWAAMLPPNSGQKPPFADHTDLYGSIDSIELGEIAWQTFSVTYKGPRPDGEAPPWMDTEYDIWYRCPRQVLRNQLANPDFAGEMDFSAKRVFSNENKREYQDFMSGNWAWDQSDILANDPATHGATFCPVILGSDKTTVSVATGQNEYYPLYLSNGLIHNAQFQRDDPKFRQFRRQLFHASLNHILQPLRPGMTVPEITLCADGHYRWMVYGLGPYIADYPEQVLLACIVQGWCPRCTSISSDLDGPGTRRSHEHSKALLETFDLKTLWDDYGLVGDLVPFTAGFPRADIHELLSPDLLHQVIKGTFKDHLVTWVEEYLELQHGKAAAAKILADIDRRIAATPSFPGLRRFPQGRGFKQWTGDDSKALMKVYLPAIAGHVPSQMVQALSAFLDFCYLVRRSIIDEQTLTDITLRYNASIGLDESSSTPV
ncbi:hypothetical protein A0H81_10321 [Grifola frondosa]|uniref:Uncharacterized protein n=1 Tax=Grifola frondosa TaxID=5627 RepID=A0A1C7LY18_GRIFR|nr:hypothetical protein A0H81_10321 [Grifola frondosa]